MPQGQANPGANRHSSPGCGLPLCLLSPHTSEVFSWEAQSPPARPRLSPRFKGAGHVHWGFQCKKGFCPAAGDSCCLPSLTPSPEGREGLEHSEDWDCRIPRRLGVAACWACKAAPRQGRGGCRNPQCCSGRGKRRSPGVRGGAGEPCAVCLGLGFSSIRAPGW